MKSLILTSCLLCGVAIHCYAAEMSCVGILPEDNYSNYIHVLSEEEEFESNLEFLKRNCFEIDIFDDKTCCISGCEGVIAKYAESVINKELVDFLRSEGIYKGDYGINPSQDICITIVSEDSDYGRTEYKRIEDIVVRVLAQEHSLTPSLKVILKNHMAWGYPPPPPPSPLVDVIEELMIEEDDVVIADEGVVSEEKMSISDTDGVYTDFDVEPSFPGGLTALMGFIKTTQKFPSDALQGGRVTLKFIVEKDGSFSNVEVLRSPDDALSQEAIRVLNSMPLWKPAQKHGTIVRSRYMLPFTFRKEGKL